MVWQSRAVESKQKNFNFDSSPIDTPDSNTDSFLNNQVIVVYISDKVYALSKPICYNWFILKSKDFVSWSQ